MKYGFMKFWLATHRVDLHRSHGDLIGCRLENVKGDPEPSSLNFKKMRKGDKAVVCSRSGDLVFGIYNIVSDGFIITDDPEWGTAYCYRINLELRREPYPSFRKFKDEFKNKLNFTSDNKRWEGSSVGWIIEISKEDFDLFVTYLTSPV